MLSSNLYSIIKSLCIASIILTLTACLDFGSDDDDDNGGAITAAGYFIDSGVGNLRYDSTDHSGWTDSTGFFQYTPGQTITFSYDGLELGKVSTSQSSLVVTPATVLGLANPSDADGLPQNAKNLLVLLQSMDSDRNPENGIYLEGARFDSSVSNSVFANLDLSADANDFATDFGSILDSAYGNRTPAFVVKDEASAVAHFNETLAKLTATASFEGRWIMRDGEHGDVSAIYEFASNGQVTVTEYEDCNNNDVYWASTPASADSACSKRPVFTQSYTAVGNSLTLQGSNISDSCLIVSASDIEITASCVFQGVDEVETVVFQKDNTVFTDATVVGKYDEIEGGSNGHISTIEFTNSGGTKGGSYEVVGFDENAPADGGSGTITSWSVGSEGTTLSGAGTDDENLTFSFDYRLAQSGPVYLAGNWITDYDDAEGSAVNWLPFILRSDATHSNISNIASFSGFHGIYDANSGECKGVLKPSSNTPTVYEMYASASSNTLICDYPTNWESLTPINAFNVNTNGDLLELTENATTQYCTVLHVQLSGTIKYVACSAAGSAEFDLEIWRPL